jgi:hypothetical protein
MFFLSNEDEFQQLWNRIYGDEPPEAFDALSRSRMQWGSVHEDHATAQLLRLFPTASVYESEFLEHPDPKYAWTGASPDGLLTLPDGDYGVHRVNLEYKCPGPNKEGKWKSVTCPHYYYMCQIHMEMAVSETTSTLFVVWNPTCCRVWWVPFNQHFYEETMRFLTLFRSNEWTFGQFNLARLQLKTFAEYHVAKKAICLDNKRLLPSGDWNPRGWVAPAPIDVPPEAYAKTYRRRETKASTSMKSLAKDLASGASLSTKRKSTV